MTRSSELVMRLNGSEASDGTEFDLVFGRSEGKLCCCAACHADTAPHGA